MDKALRPGRLEVSPNSPDATKIYKHWKTTFEYFLAVLPQDNLNKLHVLTNFVAPDIYDLFSQDTTYDNAMTTLNSNYVKAPNEIYSRHLLATRKQQPGESFDSYLTALKSLAKDCSFKDVSAVVYQNESIRDAFIAGTISVNVRQRLLEKKSITLDEMITTARSLESAEKNAESYMNQTSGNVAAMAYSAPNESNLAAIVPPANSVQKLKPRQNTPTCWNCGNLRHPRASCPARDAVCHNCQRMGHFSKLCKSAKFKHQSTSAAGEALTEDKTTASAIFNPQLI